MKNKSFRDLSLSGQNIQDIKKYEPDEIRIDLIINSALRSPDPDSSLVFLARFLEAMQAGHVKYSFTDEDIAMLCYIFGSSEFLSTILIRRPETGIELGTSPFTKRDKPIARMHAELSEMLAGISDYPSLLKTLRSYKQSEMLRIGARDLLDLGSCEEITSELSSLASATLHASYEVCSSILASEYGVPYYQDEADNWQNNTFTILGMGKLGGNELNFSSDIDLIYLYASDRGEVRGGGKQRTIFEYYSKLAEMITKSISQNTEDGFVFRVDLRLRPDGQNGPIVNSIRNAEQYYESWGETWERSAMLKARPVAGDSALGERFLSDISPFIYRKYLDFSTIEDIKEMKSKIDRELSHKPELYDVKLGKGGIREIEFLVQAYQLINAGKDKTLREKNSLAALIKLRDRGLIPPESHDLLSSAYMFLRTVEHRIQVENERQTHALPVDEAALSKLAWRCRLESGDELLRLLDMHRMNVRRLFDSLFHEPSREYDDIPSSVFSLFSDDIARDNANSILESLGFEDIEESYERLLNIRDAIPSMRLAQKDRKVLRKLTPRLFLEASRSPDPDMAISNLGRFLSSAGAKGSYYSLLLENPNMAGFLINLFGTSDFLSQFLISHPELLDNLLRIDTLRRLKTRDEMSHELSDISDRVEDYEELLDAVRKFRNIELIRIGMNDIGTVAGLQETCSQLTILAELSLEVALRNALKEMVLRYGEPFSGSRKAGIAVLGMGKLGGGEMTYSSDLDLVFLYSEQGETRGGGKTITNQEFFSRTAQRMISFLTLQTREGYLYKVDARIRPSGGAGMLVSSIDSFRRYHDESARVWERQAMIKARAVAGDMDLGREAEGIIQHICYKNAVGEEDRSEIYRIRERMGKELAKEGAHRYNVKMGRGGIVDIEFTVQFLQLLYGSRYINIRSQNSLDALSALCKEGLINLQEYKAMNDAYIFLMRADSRLRILHNVSTDVVELEPVRLTKLAKRLGYKSTSSETPDAAFLRDYRLHTEIVREIFNRYLCTNINVESDFVAGR